MVSRPPFCTGRSLCRHPSLCKDGSFHSSFPLGCYPFPHGASYSAATQAVFDSTPIGTQQVEQCSHTESWKKTTEVEVCASALEGEDSVAAAHGTAHGCNITADSLLGCLSNSHAQQIHPRVISGSSDSSYFITAPDSQEESQVSRVSASPCASVYIGKAPGRTTSSTSSFLGSPWCLMIMAPEQNRVSRDAWIF